MARPVCPNCDRPFEQGDRYCAQCGQAVIVREDLRSFLQQFLGDYFTYDSKLVRSLVPLLKHPGHLTTEYMAGRRARYIPPLRLFIFLSIVFFLVFGWSVPRVSDATLAEAVEDRLFWDHFFTSVLPKLFFLFLPLFAFLVYVLHPGLPGGYITAFVLSTHFHAFVFLLFTLYGVLSNLLARSALVSVNQGLALATIAWTLVYLWASLRKVQRRRLGSQLARSISLVVAYILVMALTSVLVVWSLY